MPREVHLLKTFLMMSIENLIDATLHRVKAHNRKECYSFQCVPCWVPADSSMKAKVHLLFTFSEVQNGFTSSHTTCRMGRNGVLKVKGPRHILDFNKMHHCSLRRVRSHYVAILSYRANGRRS